MIKYFLKNLNLFKIVRDIFSESYKKWPIIDFEVIHDIWKIIAWKCKKLDCRDSIVLYKISQRYSSWIVVKIDNKLSLNISLKIRKNISSWKCDKNYFLDIFRRQIYLLEILANLWAENRFRDRLGLSNFFHITLLNYPENWFLGCRIF